MKYSRTLNYLAAWLLLLVTNCGGVLLPDYERVEYSVQARPGHPALGTIALHLRTYGRLINGIERFRYSGNTDTRIPDSCFTFSESVPKACEQTRLHQAVARKVFESAGIFKKVQFEADGADFIVQYSFVENLPGSSPWIVPSVLTLGILPYTAPIELLIRIEVFDSEQHRLAAIGEMLPAREWTCSLLLPVTAHYSSSALFEDATYESYRRLLTHMHNKGIW